LNQLHTLPLLIGRLLLGLYFILPGIMKITGYSGTVAYMTAHNVPMISILLPLTIAMQIAGGIALIIGYQGKLVAFILAILVLVISIYMHNFWVYEQGMERAHEMQNFIKNLAIMAGLLVISATGTGKFSVSSKAD
jgi:putative oxidoreductase